MPLYSPSPAPLFHCLIRTHHITSRKKLHRVRRFAEHLQLDWVLIRSGGCPGIMFAETRDEDALKEWVTSVQALRYKDFRCVAKPSPSVISQLADGKDSATWEETTSMQTFGERLEARGLGSWYKKLMFA
ncbi:hypothetical protein CC79DRAFT_1367602 [Sarocladium strictum]